MKKSLLLVLFLAIGLSSLAQRPPRKVDREKLEAARVAFITTRLDLSTEQAQVFWPLFNEYDKKKRKGLREIARLSDGREEISEEEAKSRIQQRFEIQRRMLAEEEEFSTKASEVLTYKQILALNKINVDFTRQLYQRQRRGPRDNM